MSEHRWVVKKAWIGVNFALPLPWVSEDYTQSELCGVIRRRAEVQATGHFCFADVQYRGELFTASGAESRIYPFHSLTLHKGQLPENLELVYLGFCRDHRTPAFVSKRLRIVELTGAGNSVSPLTSIPPEKWQIKWFDENYRKEAWRWQGMLHVEEEARKELTRRKRFEAKWRRRDAKAQP